jgi:hypothetical protein
MCKPGTLRHQSKFHSPAAIIYNRTTIKFKRRPEMRLHPVSLWLAAFCVVAVPVWSDNEICLVNAVDGTVENGVGAEPGVVREFVQDLDVPPECQTIAGNTWVLAHELRVTRVNPSSPTVNAQVMVRRLEATRNMQPAQVLIESRFVAVDTSTFPAFGVGWTSFDGPPRAAPALELGPAVLLDGDQAANQFVTVDQGTATPVRTCFTRAGVGAWELCTNGNPAIRGVGLTLQVTPVLADFPNLGPGIGITSSLPSGSNTAHLDFSGTGPAGDLIDLVELREPGNPTPICSSPGLFPFLCSLSASQEAKLRHSELVIVLTPTIIPPFKSLQTPIESQLISADDYVFANGFEGGDPGLWSSVSP